MPIGIGCVMIRRGCVSVFLVSLVCLVVFHFGSVGSFRWFGDVRCGGTGWCNGLVRFFLGLGDGSCWC